MSEQQLNYISSYRLAEERLQKHLQAMFPGETISITVRCISPYARVRTWRA